MHDSGMMVEWCMIRCHFMIVVFVCYSCASLLVSKIVRKCYTRCSFGVHLSVI